MKRATMLVLVQYESDERETINTTGETVPEPIRHIPIVNRPTVHKPLPEALHELAMWVAR